MNLFSYRISKVVLLNFKYRMDSRYWVDLDNMADLVECRVQFELEVLDPWLKKAEIALW